jgi:hypothetical protein
MANFIIVNREYKDDGGLFERMYLYITNPDKAIHGFVGGKDLYTRNGVEYVGKQMREVSNTLNGNQDRALYHFILSFDDEWEDDITPSMAYKIAYEFSYFFGEYQVAYAVHENTMNTHIHFILNATNFCTGQKFPNKKETYEQIILFAHSIFIPYSYKTKKKKRLCCMIYYQSQEER